MSRFYLTGHRNVGFLRYWTIPNIPLFALAMPALYVLLKSGQWGLRAESTGASDILLLQKLALPQIALATMAITSYHVQIITRLSSGCAVWYWYVASQAIASKEASNGARESHVVVKWMVMYALIQGVLFASFLPPA